MCIGRPVILDVEVCSLVILFSSACVLIRDCISLYKWITTAQVLTSLWLCGSHISNIKDSNVIVSCYKSHLHMFLSADATAKWAPQSELLHQCYLTQWVSTVYSSETNLLQLRFSGVSSCENRQTHLQTRARRWEMVYINNILGKTKASHMPFCTSSGANRCNLSLN